MENTGQRRQRRSHTVIVLALVGLLAGSVGCSPWKWSADHDVVRHGILFEAFRENGDGSKIGDLASDTIIDGWPCKKGFVAFHADWRLDELQLSQEYRRNGILMPEGTWVFPDRNGNPGVCIFPHDHEIQGHICRGSGSGKLGFMTAFYPDGRLKWFYTRDPVTINGVACGDSLFQAIYLHHNGRLQQCKLSEPAVIGGVEYPEGAILRLDPGGRALARGR